MNGCKFIQTWLMISGLVIAAIYSSALSAESVALQPVQRHHSTEFEQLNKIFSANKPKSGSFIQHKQLHNFDFPITSSGRFSISSSQTLHWDVLEPIKSSMILDSEGIRLSTNGHSNQPQRPEVSTIASIIRALLSMDRAVLEKYFSITASDLSPRWQVRLTPKDDLMAQLITQVTVSGDSFIERVTILDQRGDTTRILLTSDTD